MVARIMSSDSWQGILRCISTAELYFTSKGMREIAICLLAVQSFQAYWLMENDTQLFTIAIIKTFVARVDNNRSMVYLYRDSKLFVVFSLTNNCSLLRVIVTWCRLFHPRTKIVWMLSIKTYSKSIIWFITYRHWLIRCQELRPSKQQNSSKTQIGLSLSSEHPFVTN